MALVTYSQMMEDILLYRALKHVDPDTGFYIDVGGYHPTYHSVTKLFYDIGWSGVNIEPGQSQFPQFVEERQRDVNLQVALSDHSGTAEFFERDQTSTLETRFLENSANTGTRYQVTLTTLDKIFEDHARGDVHFLKIDVEGHEAAVIRGWDRTRYRPWIVIIEAFEPNRLDCPTHQEWEEMLLSCDYNYACSDGLNRYYVAAEQSDLQRFFEIPADDFHKSWDLWRCLEVERQRDSLSEALKKANNKLSELGLKEVI